LSGSVRPDKPALRVSIEQPGLPKREFTVSGGHLMVVPLAIGEQAKLKIRVLARGAEVNGRRSLTVEAVGGTVGLILDARGRPLLKNASTAQRADLMTRWVSEITGDERRDIPAEWLKPVDDPLPPSPDRPRRRGGRRRGKQAAAPVAEQPDTDTLSLDDLRK
nr:hypothetical protein [Anaerolineae bacterium]